MSNQVLLVMDVHEPITRLVKDNTTFLSSVSKAIQTARSQGIPVFYIVLGFRKGYPEASASMKQRLEPMNLDGDTPKVFPEQITPQAEDLIITKKRISAFAGSDLEMLLRVKGINHLILTGVATGGVVLSTLRAAADKDYQLTVLSDACADADEEVHRVLTTKIFPRQAKVLTVEEWAVLMSE